MVGNKGDSDTKGANYGVDLTEKKIKCQNPLAMPGGGRTGDSH